MESRLGLVEHSCFLRICSITRLDEGVKVDSRDGQLLDVVVPCVCMLRVGLDKLVTSAQARRSKSLTEQMHHSSLLSYSCKLCPSTAACSAQLQ